MGEPNFDQEYELLVKEGLARGEIQIRQDERELREAPRFKLDDCKIAVPVQPSFPVVDLSACGIAFYADLPFTPGDYLNVILTGAFGFPARVIACTLVETDPALLETRYRVQCCFDDAFHGKQLLVMMNEMQKVTSRSSVN